jgi:hypothetical protein
MNAATHHADLARRAAPFVHQTMRDRGMACQRTDLDQALLEITPAQLQQVQDATLDLARGVDNRDAFSVLSALRTVSARAARAALRDAGIFYRADVLLPLAADASSGPAFKVALASLQRGDVSPQQREEARTSLVGWCGPLDQSDLLGQAPDGSPGKEQPHVNEPIADGPASRNAPPSPAPLSRASAAGRQVKVYGKAAALTCESAPVRGRNSEPEGQGLHTIMIEGANARGDGTYDWADKTIFACSLRELPQLLAVLLGWVPEVEFKFHGERSDKQLLLQHQEHGLYVRLRGASDLIGVPVTGSDRYALAMLVLNVMIGNEPHGNASAVLAVCRATMSPSSTSPHGG